MPPKTNKYLAKNKSQDTSSASPAAAVTASVQSFKAPEMHHAEMVTLRYYASFVPLKAKEKLSSKVDKRLA